MDKLQHIDQLLKRASQEPANALVSDSDWIVIEKKLRHRKNRIYAMWFFLALVSVSVGLGLLLHNSQPTNPTAITDSPINKEKDVQNEEITSLEQINKEIQGPDEYQSDLQVQNVTTVDVPSFNTNTIQQPLEQYINRENSISDINPVRKLDGNSLCKVGLPIILTDKEINRSLLKELSLISLLNKVYKNQEVKGRTNGYWEVGFAFTPSLSSKIVSENNSLSGLINKNYYDFVGDNEKVAFSNNYGINLQYHNSTKFYISSGIFVAQRTELIDYQYTITEGPIYNSDKTKIDSYFDRLPSDHEQITYKGSNSYHFIEIPLNIGFKTPISRNFESRTQVGLSYLGLLDASGKKGDYSTLELNNVQDLNLETQNIATSIKSGLYYNTLRFAIGIEPIFGLNLNSLSDKTTSPIKVKPYNYGINISTNFKLIKK
ncbi:hypothetical protein OAD66_08895 [Bacteroidia bacterium]|nr:hypothetical protein [Bacteroidia bacterium]MDB9883234.1 hypothetical protein [Bacteroidia bacterium]